MPYTRTSRYGQLQVPLGTTGGAAADTDAFGVTIIGVSSAEVYTLGPPAVAGQVKYIVFTSSSTVATVVKGSTSAAQTVSFVSPSGSTYTVLKKAATASTNADTVVQLIGYNSTSWLIANAWPPSTAPSATNYGGMITLSTT